MKTRLPVASLMLGLMLGLTFGLSALPGVAFAQDAGIVENAAPAPADYPACSKTVTDECMEASTTAKPRAMHHHVAYRRHRAEATATTKS